MKSFKQFLSEMPISSFNLLGNWDKNSPRKHGFNSQDVGILTNPKGVEKIKKLWSNSKEEFDLYFIKQKNAWKHVEVGEVNQEWVKKELGLDIQPREDAITIIFTNNIAAATDKMPMTAWTIAHRLGHATRRDPSHEYYTKEITRDFSNLLKDIYRYQTDPYRFSSNYRRDELTLKGLANAVGTMQSARQRKVRNFGEFTHELIAQYIITGKVRFNPLPSFLITKNTQAWGRPNPQGIRSSLDKKALEDSNETLEQLADKYEYMFDDLFGALLGRMFVM